LQTLLLEVLFGMQARKELSLMLIHKHLPAAYLARLEELAKNQIRRGLRGRVSNPTKVDATTAKWALTIMNEIKNHPERRSSLEVSALGDTNEKDAMLEKLEAADNLVQINVLRRNSDETYAFHSPLYEYTFLRNSWYPL
jgi:hypothetical protein